MATLPSPFLRLVLDKASRAALDDYRKLNLAQHRAHCQERILPSGRRASVAARNRRSLRTTRTSVECSHEQCLVDYGDCESGGG